MFIQSQHNSLLCFMTTFITIYLINIRNCGIFIVFFYEQKMCIHCRWYENTNIYLRVYIYHTRSQHLCVFPSCSNGARGNAVGLKLHYGDDAFDNDVPFALYLDVRTTCVDGVMSTRHDTPSRRTSTHSIMSECIYRVVARFIIILTPLC